MFSIFSKQGIQVLTGFNLGQVFLVVATLVGILRRNYDQVTCVSLPLYTPFVCESVCLTFCHTKVDISPSLALAVN